MCSSDLLNNIIGGQTINEKEVQPVVIGFVGSDLSISANLRTKGTNGDAKALSSITRDGDVTTNINSGNVLGGFGGSASLAIGNINADYSTTFWNMPITITVETNGNDKTTINGDVTTYVNNSANLAGFAAGSGAIAMGGTSRSEISGDTNLVIDSDGSHRNLEGISTTLAGGGAAVTTLGGTATSTVGGSTNISIKNGLSALVAGGGVAISGDAAGALDKGKDNAPSDTTLGGITVNVYDTIQGGTATAEVKKDSNISITGESVAAGVVGGGVAASYHSYENRDDTDKNTENNGKPGGSSTATSTVGGKTTININVESGNLGDVVKNIKQYIKDADIKDNDGHIATLSKTADALGKQAVVAGVVGGGLAAAVGDANSSATVESGNVEINLDKGYVVGTFAGGAAVAAHDKTTWRNDSDSVLTANATVKDATVNVENGTKAIGVFGNGLALGMQFEGKENVKLDEANDVKKDANVNVTADNTVINVNGKADGVYGSGLVFSNGGFNSNTMQMKTEGKSTINLNQGSTSDKLNFSQLQSAITAITAIGGESVVGEKLPEYLDDLNRVAKDVAVAGGGIAVGQGGYNYVKESEINLNNATVKGDVIAGGVASASNTGTQQAKVRVDTSNVYLNGGTIEGSFYAGGISDNKPHEITLYTAKSANSTVGDITAYLNGTEITGEISGRGLKHTTDGKFDVDTESTTGTSTLKIIGNNTLSPLESALKSQNASKINNFDVINVDANSVTTLTNLTVNNATPLINSDLGNGKKGVITVAKGAVLNLDQLTPLTGNETYYVAGNYDTAQSMLWGEDKYVYDRTETFAQEEYKNNKTEYHIKVNKVTGLRPEDQKKAADSTIKSLNAGLLKNTISKYFSDPTGVAQSAPGFKEFLSDLSKETNKEAAYAGMGRGAMVGEMSGATNTSTTFAGDMADTAALRLSFTQDRVTGDNKVDEDGNIWAKYLHNKYKGEGLGSSFGDMHFDASYDGIMVGSDFAKKGKVQSGIAFAYADGDSSGIGSEDDFDLWGLTLYGNVKNDDTNIIADIGYSRGDHETSSYVLDKKMTADRDISVFSLGVRAEKLITKGSLQVVPYTGLRYLNVDPSSYTAYYNGKKAFDVDADRQNIFTLPVGVSLRNENVTKNGWTITPQFDLSYVWAFGDTDNDMTINVGGAADKLSYTVMDSGSWLTSLALEAAKGDWTYGLGYSWQKGNDARSDKWFVNAEYKF